MTTSIYLTSSEGSSGKSAIALGLLDTLTKKVGRVGVFRPVVRSRADGPEGDDALALLVPRLDPTLGITPADAAGVTYDDVHGDPEAALGRILDAYHALAARCEAVVVVGSDFTDVGNPAELAFNARIAANLGTPIVLVLNGRNPVDLAARTPAEIRGALEATLPPILSEHAAPVAVVANRVEADALDEVRDALRTELVEEAAQSGRPAEPAPTVWALPESKLIFAPSVKQLLAAVDGELIAGDPELLGREALGVTVSGMSMEHVLERAGEGSVAIVASDRTETLVALLLAQRADTFPSLAAIVVNGPFEFSDVVRRLIEGVPTTVPIIRTAYDTFETAQRIVATRGKLLDGSPRKVVEALNLFERHVPASDLAELFDVAPSSVVTPLMFEHRLLARARNAPQHIVLPEGDDDRILRAADALIARQVVRLTILGDEDAVRRRGKELGLDLGAADVLSPHDPGYVDRFAEEYTRLRAHRGMTLDVAHERVQDVSYFGTMLVHLGLADGMVSGAAHTTAHTIKPSFEIIKTRPGVSIVSSVFLMALADRVLVYGDCAVNPDPNAAQLADIAISSAATAEQFGVEPRVALLSYSTGDSGHGADVDKVREATRLVHERAPELAVEGPIQYDAATDAVVAAKKLPGSAVAGRATVLVFPDLNTGNNTYKAVQRSSGAVAIGPVLQGLNKPINDLSRGALVDDIINTVAITAIQAQFAEAAASPTEAAGAAAVAQG